MSSAKATTVKITPEAFARRMRELRDGLSLEKLGELIGVTAAAVQNYENGRIPDVEVLLNICATFKKTIPWLLTGRDNFALQPEMVRELPEEYGMDRADAKMIRELKELLVDADDEIKRHLRNQIKLLKRAAQAPIRADENPTKEE